MAETRIYVDSNVYIDYFKNRSDRLRPWGEFAHQLFSRMFDCEFRVIFSAAIFKELKKHLYEKQINEFLDRMKEAKKVEFVHINAEVKKWAARTKGVSHYADRLHYALAQKAGADFIVTRNWKDFYGLGDIPALPSEFI